MGGTHWLALFKTKWWLWLRAVRWPSPVPGLVDGRWVAAPIVLLGDGQDSSDVTEDGHQGRAGLGPARRPAHRKTKVHLLQLPWD